MNISLIELQYHRQVLIPRFSLKPPNADGKPVVSVDELRLILTYNIAFDISIFASERQRIQLPACYLILSYTGARPAELVDGERKKPKDGSLEELFGSKVVEDDECAKGSDESAPDEASRELDKLLLAETVGRGRPKALCYEDILLMIVRHPVTEQDIPVMAIKFVHHKGSDNRPKPYVFAF
jgi:hypothetical protein